ncbi:NmrA family transcriptional regulator [Leifsonia sp. Root227]|uniref:SDR family oxidoreductase n=1 Tax=unclassified Leifsonia TaxID=2663824 RepID=UPI000701490E|nr:SDR family oxidoreductase [Leifsonia sp. Root227]KRC51678.1 NmrA family transcriptional regulator [Leifsonia sp. Root227]
MKFVVIGGTGQIGTPLVELLRQAGHDVVAASPSTGVNSVTGEGLADALAGADVVLDIPNSPSFEDAAVLDFFQRSTANLVEAQKEAGVGHHIVLSIVGADRMHDIGYMRAKVAQERLVRESGLPFTIVRATQFFEFIPRLAEGAADGDTIRLSPVLMQPIAAADVSAALADIATQAPTNDVIELAGPEQLRLAELGRRVLEARGDARTVVADESAGYFGGTVTDTSLVPGNDEAITALRIAPTRFEDWLRASGSL